MLKPTEFKRMEFKDYYAVLGVASSASHDEIKRAYRKLARKFHPDVTKDPNGEAHFKALAEAYEALNDAPKRKAYDAAVARHKNGEAFATSEEADARSQDAWQAYSGRGSSGRGGGMGGGIGGGMRGGIGNGSDMDHSDFFESLFGQAARASAGARAGDQHSAPRYGQRERAKDGRGEDQHASIRIEVEDAYHGGHRQLSLSFPHQQGQTPPARQLDVNIPKGIRAGQHLRLAGQGSPGWGNGPAGDLYLEIEFAPHARYRVDGRDVHIELLITPWEAALGATVPVTTPDGELQLSVPAHSVAGRKLRMKGKGIPSHSASHSAGDFYASLNISLPPSDTALQQDAYRDMAKAFPSFDPRAALET
jgi:curved DNA-binding protein